MSTTLPAPLRSFDDLSVGQEFGFGSIRMEREEILDFARRYDPQPFHLDEAAAGASIFGGLIASGLHTQAAAFGHIIRTGWVKDVSLGGTEQVVRWPAPVRPGDEIGLTARVEELIPSRSKPDRGVAKIRYIGRRVSDGTVVLDILGTHFLKR
ncbi:MaoC/PaaZ C-terminal domain-containing protein [Roseicella aquatilis]|uniref:Acyl dehydratase n=1 Tax=Roseicella aquatilis TaxID=2527868 RepID=A0A4R4DBN1_9PROT|nr:MaoC/PaaZ C-terminal domain-containing protein [Roseicella aquatilis]TCZ57922.1 acyl dehydratase [Roseicella aquatilis]